MEYSMHVCLNKLKEFESKYPEIIRAKEISRCVLTITSLYANDAEIEDAFANLEKLLKQKNDGN